jgi:hypothetical protein
METRRNTRPSDGTPLAEGRFNKPKAGAAQCALQIAGSTSGFDWSDHEILLVDIGAPWHGLPLRDRSVCLRGLQ